MWKEYINSDIFLTGTFYTYVYFFQFQALCLFLGVLFVISVSSDYLAFSVYLFESIADSFTFSSV